MRWCILMVNNRADFKKLAMTRLDDAKVLLKNKRNSAAFYLAGYAVECAFKACLAKKTRQYQFPPELETVRKRYYTHDLQTLAKECGLSDAFEKGDPQLEKYWSSVKDWSERSRYDPHADVLARDMLRAIDDPASGVLQCIKRYW